MKKQDLIKFLKSKGVYITLILGVLIIVAALSINKSLSDTQKEQNGLVDLNENPDIVLDNDLNSDMNYADNFLNQKNNDMLLEYDIYNGQTESIINNNKHADNLVDKSDMDDVSEHAANGSMENILSQPVDAASVADAPKETEKKEDNANPTEEKKPEDLTEVSLMTIADLSFSPTDGIIWPLRGNVILGYSADHAVYHATLDQFKTNPAVLISCEQGAEVKATVQGIVTDITNNHRTGLTLTLAIGNDYSLVYGQLADVNCEIGDILEVGEVFAHIEKVTKSYTLEGEHLYFQIYKGEDTVDPMELLKDEA